MHLWGAVRQLICSILPCHGKFKRRSIFTRSKKSNGSGELENSSNITPLNDCFCMDKQNSSQVFRRAAHWNQKSQVFLRRERGRRRRDLALKSSSTFILSQPHFERLLLATRGGAIDSTSPIDVVQQAASYFKQIQSQIQKVPSATLADIVEDVSPQAKQDVILQILVGIAEHMKISPRLSIHQATLNLVQEKKLLRASCLDHEAQILAARQLVFVAFGWLTMLFTSTFNPTSPILQIHGLGTKCFENEAQSMQQMAKRPFDEVLNGFGTILPSTAEPSEYKGDDLQVRSLNAASLCKIREVKIEWVLAVSAHLDFNENTQTLHLFALPSFCVIHLDDSVAFEHVFLSFHNPRNRPNLFCSQRFFKEILLSFQLLFRDTASARRYYRDVQRARVRELLGGTDDAYLDRLCGLDDFKESVAAAPVRTSFGKESDFPIFSERWSTIQRYLQRQQPTHVKSLWYDRRDLQLWYNFWPAVIFGVLAILLSAFQSLLQLIQTVYATKAFYLQKNQSASS